MGELGLLGPIIPEDFGGIRTSYVAHGLLAPAGERIDSDSRWMRRQDW